MHVVKNTGQCVLMYIVSGITLKEGNGKSHNFYWEL